MRIAPVHVDHPDVRVIQPTWHCLKRFRERQSSPPGTQQALDALSAALRDAHITTRPPRGVQTSGDWALWAVCGRLAFPLVPVSDGLFTAPTCLAAGCRSLARRTSGEPEAP